MDDVSTKEVLRVNQWSAASIRASVATGWNPFHGVDASIASKCLLAMKLDVAYRHRARFLRTDDVAGVCPTSSSFVSENDQAVLLQLLSDLVYEISSASVGLTKSGLICQTDLLQTLLGFYDMDGAPGLRRFVRQYAGNTVRILGRPTVTLLSRLSDLVCEARHARQHQWLQEDDAGFEEQRRRMLLALSAVTRVVPQTQEELLALAELILDLASADDEETEISRFVPPLTISLVRSVSRYLS